MAVPWTISTKKVPGIGSTVFMSPSRLATTFHPPALPGSLQLPPMALFAAMARCGALSRVPAALSSALTQAAAAVTPQVVDDAGSSFDLMASVGALADFERTSLSGRVGAGVTDLLMSSLGYVWRDLASALISTRGKLADFAYDGGPASGHGLVLAEAKGSLAVGANASATKGRAEDGYKNQVAPHIGGSWSAGTVVHGYAVGFGAWPSVPGASIHVAETAASPVGPTPSAPTIPGVGGTTRVSVSMALGNYRAVFMRANAPAVFYAIERALGGITPVEPQAFRRVRSGGRSFLFGLSPTFRHEPDPPLQQTFAIAEEIAEPFLDQLQALLSDPFGSPAYFDLPVLQPVMSSEDGALPPYVLFADGFAYLSRWTDDPRTGFTGWSPADGLSSTAHISAHPSKVD